MAVTNQSIGADLVHEGGWAEGIGPLTGKGIGVAVIDSGVANVPELRGRIVASVDFTDDAVPGWTRTGTARTWPASSRRPAEPVRRDRRAWRRARTSSA